MARALRNRLTHLLSSRSSSTPRCSSQVSQLHGSRVSHRFWNQLNLEYSQRNKGAKCDAATKPDCSTSNPRIDLLKGTHGKPSVGELLSKWCCPFNDKLHHDQAPQFPYYRQRAPQFPQPASKELPCPPEPCPPDPCDPCSQPEPCPPDPCDPCSQSEPCPPDPCDPCPQPQPCPPEPCDPCQNSGSHECKRSTPSSRNPCNPYRRPKSWKPRPYPVKPCEPCPRPRKPSCPAPKSSLPPPRPKPICPDPCDPCRLKPTPMSCPVSTPTDCPMPTRCSRDWQKQAIHSNLSNGTIPMAIKINRSLTNRGTSQMRGFHGSTMGNMRSNDNDSSVKKRHRKRIDKKGKKSKMRARKLVHSDSMPLGKIAAKPRSKCNNVKPKKDHTINKPDKTRR